MDNKHIFSINLKRFMAEKNVSRNEIANVLGINYFTISDWCNGRKYPRMDKVELLANYFGVLKSDLIEQKSVTTEHTVQITDGEMAVLNLFRQVPEDKKQMVVQMITIALGNQK